MVEEVLANLMNLRVYMTPSTHQVEVTINIKEKCMELRIILIDFMINSDTDLKNSSEYIQLYVN